MNIDIFNILHGLVGTSNLFDGITVFIATYFGIFLFIGSVIFLSLHVHRKNMNKNMAFRVKEIIFVLASVFIAWIFIIFLKSLFGEPRPFLLFDITPLIDISSPAFPSGHAAFFMALATAMSLFHSGSAWIFIPAAILIGISRIIVGVHFPADVIAGWILGFGLAFIFYYLLQKIYNSVKT